MKLAPRQPAVDQSRRDAYLERFPTPTNNAFFRVRREPRGDLVAGVAMAKRWRLRRPLFCGYQLRDSSGLRSAIAAGL